MEINITCLNFKRKFIIYFIINKYLLVASNITIESWKLIFKLFGKKLLHLLFIKFRNISIHYLHYENKIKYIVLNKTEKNHTFLVSYGKNNV